MCIRDSHNSDGTKSLTMSAVFYIRATLSGTYYESITASANITLDSIARASSVSTPNATMGSATAIAISRASSSFTHTLTYTFGTAEMCIRDRPAGGARYFLWRDADAYHP